MLITEVNANRKLIQNTNPSSNMICVQVNSNENNHTKRKVQEKN